MRPQRLWPVITALVGLLGGAIGLELAAARHVVTADVIEIRRNDDGGDEDGEDDSQAWYTQAPVDDDHRRARLLARRSDYLPALELLARLSRDHADDAMLLAEYGHWLRRAGRDAEALPVLQRAQARLPDNPTVALDRGRALAALGDVEAAITAFEAARAQRPNHTPTALTLGALLRKQQRFDEALKVLRPAAARGSNEERARALVALARTLAARGDWPRVVERLRQAVERAPASAAIWAGAAWTLSRADDPALLALAVDHALSAQRLSPQSGSIARLVGRAHDKLGKPGEAIEAYGRAVELDPGDLIARHRILHLSLDVEDLRAARRQVRAILRSAPERPESHFLAGLVEYRADALSEARKHYERAIELSPEPYPEAHFNLGLLERRAGRPDAAIAAYRAALDARPGYREAWNNLGLVLQDQGELTQALETFEHAIELSGSYVSARLNLGKCLARMGKYEASVGAFQSILKHKPHHRSARLQLAVTYRRSGQGERAVEVYRSLLRDHPRYVRAWYNLGVALGALDRTDEARAAYEQALAHDPQHFASLKNLGLLEKRGGRGAQAGRLLTEALELRPADAEVRIALAEMHLDRGDYARCTDEAQRVLSQGTRETEARALLDRCAGK